MSEERFVAIEAKLEELATGQQELKMELKTEIQDLGRQMRVLHEDTIDRIAALAPDFGPIRRRDDLKALLGRVTFDLDPTEIRKKDRRRRDRR